MLKKIGFVTAAMAAGAFVTGGIAAAGTPDEEHHHGHGHHGYHETSQIGLWNFNNIDLMHNTNNIFGACGNNINGAGLQVPLHESLNGIAAPAASPGSTEAGSESEYNCASGGIADEGTSQHN